MLKVHEINNILNLLFLLDYYQILTGITDNYSYLIMEMLKLMFNLYIKSCFVGPEDPRFLIFFFIEKVLNNMRFTFFSVKLIKSN